LINCLLGIFDDTYNNDDDAIKKLKMIEAEKLKKLRRILA